MASFSLNIFTVEIDGKPTVVLDAASLEEARGICALPEFRDDLSGLMSHGRPLCGNDASIGVRFAAGTEISAFYHAISQADPADGLTMAFLIEVDSIVVSIADPE